MTAWRALLLMVGLTMALPTALAQHHGEIDTTRGAIQEAVKGSSGDEDRPIRVSSGVMAGQILHKVQPEYPEDAKEAGVSGAVVMMAKLDKGGKIVKLDAVSGPEMLRDAALAAVKQWTYKPYILNGQPVFVLTTITVMFTLGH